MDGYQTNARFELRRGRGKKTEGRGSIWEPVRSGAEEENVLFLRRGLVLRGHTVAHWHARVLATCLLLLLEVLIVGHLLLLLVRHITRVHAWSGHATLGRVVGHVLGSLRWDIGSVNAILAGGRVGGVQAGLGEKISFVRPRYMIEVTYLNQVLALGLGDKRLQLGGGESIDEAGLGDDQQEDLGTSEDRQFVGLSQRN